MESVSDQIIKLLFVELRFEPNWTYVHHTVLCGAGPRGTLPQFMLTEDGGRCQCRGEVASKAKHIGM